MRSRAWGLIALLACTALFGRPAKADDSKPLSLMQAIQRALAGNPDLRRERVAVAKAAARQMVAAGQFDLHLDAHLATERQVVPSIACGSACVDLSAGTTTTTSLGLGLSRDLETGGRLSIIGLAQRIVASDLPALSDSSYFLGGTVYQSNLALAFTHPLLRGLGSEVALANVHKTRIEQDIAELNRQMRACNVVRDVAVAYWELAYATQDLAIRRSAVELAQEQLHTTQAMIGVGRLADADAASVERAIAQRLEELATGEQNLYFRSLDLQVLFGVPVEADLPTLAASDAPVAGASNVDESAELSRALEANPQLRALRRGLDLSQTDLAVARNTLRPRLDLGTRIGPVGRSERLPDSLRNTGGFADIGWLAELTFELPVQNRAARGRMMAAEEDLHLAQVDADDLAARIRDLVLRSTRGIRTAGKRVELGRREVEFAEKNLEAERARFQAGRATNNDVLLRQQELKDAQTRLLRATVDQSEAEVALAAVTAEVLDRYGIVLR
jgi:outer membrane protein TolC